MNTLERSGKRRRAWDWLLGRAKRWRGVRAIIMRGSRDTASRTGRGNMYVASVKWIFQVIEDGRRRLWFEGVELGRAKAGSIDEVIARITGELMIGLRRSSRGL